MKILIIGGTGNISRWFIPELVHRGHRCTLYNRGLTPAVIPEDVQVWKGDRTDHRQFETAMQAAGTFDCVIDMVGFEPADAHSAIRAFDKRIGQYIFCSTVDVYKKPQPAYPVPLNGVLGPSPDFDYAWKKWHMEGILQKASADGAFPLTIIRPGATYSEGWSPLITCFGGQLHHLARLKSGKRMILQGDGSVLWSLTHSEDVARAFANAAGNAACLGKTYNVCGDEWITWEGMHRIVALELGIAQPLFEYIPTGMLAKLAPDETRWCVDNFQFNNVFDPAEARRDLQFEHTIPYRHGARRCLVYLNRSASIPDATETAYYDTILAAWDRIVIQAAYGR